MDRVNKAAYLSNLSVAEACAFAAGAFSNTFVDSVFSFYNLDPPARVFFSLLAFSLSLLAIIAARSFLTLKQFELYKSIEPLIDEKITEKWQNQGQRIKLPQSHPHQQPTESSQTPF
jgi:hypothetical protein